MSPAHESPYHAEQGEPEPVDRRTMITAVQVVAAWLIAFVCVALLAFFS